MPVTNSNWIRRLLALVVLATAWPPDATAGDAAAVGATLAADGRTFSVTGAGLSGCHGSFSASIKVGEETHELSAAGGRAAGPAQKLTEETPDGPAEVTATAFHFELEQVDLLFRLGRVPGVPGVLAQVGIRNAGKDPVRLVSVTPLELEFRVAGNPAEWLVTALDQSVNEVAPVVALDAIRTPLKIHEYGGFYRRDGTGFLFGPVGAPVAFVDARVAPVANDKVSFRVAADMSGVQVDAGETRWGQQVVILLEPPRTALPRWAEWVAKTHRARPAKGALSGWNSWNFLGEAVTGKDVLAVVDEVVRSPARLRPGVIQIDDGYQDITGRKETNDKFPEGLAFYAQRIAATGARPGLYLEAFGTTGAARRLDSPDWNGLVQSVQQAVRSGFTYLKINHLNLGELTGGKRTAFEIYRDNYAAIRKAAGEDAYLAYCDSSPNRLTVGLADACRIGADANRTARSVAGTSQADLRFAMADVLRSYHLHGRWFAVDNDTYYMGTDRQNVSEIAGKWPLVRTWMSMVGLSCGTAITSDPLYWESFKPYWRNMEVMTPPANEHTEVLDLGTSHEWPRLLGRVQRAWGDSAVALLWNPGVTEQAVTLDFTQAGLNPRHRYAVWSFWDNRFLGVAQGTWTTQSLEPLASQQLCFTDLDHTPNKPVLVGSNLHIYCGAAEIQHVTSTRGSMVIDLTDAGARDGDLFVYSRLPLLLKSAIGCAVTGVSQAGENVWRISLAERQRGVPQRLHLTVTQPVTRQTWFWLLIATVPASLAFAASRYMVGMRLQREHALEKERARIAADLHDEMGANLTQIGLLCERARNELDSPASAQAHLDRALASTRALAGQLDAVVWSVDPSNDTLEHFARYLSNYAADFLALAGLRVRLEVPEELPAVTLSSASRHHLFLAAKEALHNVVQHAGATRVTLRIRPQPGAVCVEIEDDGKGLAAAGTSAPGADGLDNMARRLARIHGHCDYLPGADGRGMLLRFTLPLQRNHSNI